MVTAPSTEDALDLLEEYEDIVPWINDTLARTDSSDLPELHQHITQLIDALDFACESTSSNVEKVIDDVSRGIPRLAYDLHFMKDGALSLQIALAKVHERSLAAIPEATGKALDQLKLLDTAKTHMEAAREVLREAESWSTLELEVTTLLAEKSYAKAAARLSEASRSMVVFQNTPEYDPRRTLMVNLQNQLEASLSSALVAAINIQDLSACREYFSIFSNIQRESEFRNYYNGSRRVSIVTFWQDKQLSDCRDESTSSDLLTDQTFAHFLPEFYASFVALLNQERISIPSIFPDPPQTLSSLITSGLSVLHPTFRQRLSSVVMYYGDSALEQLIIAFRATEEFSIGVQKAMEKIRYSTAVPLAPEDISATEVPQQPTAPSHSRRRSMRMSMTWRSNPHRSTSGGLSISKTSSSISEDMEWEQELFQPFLDFQIDYGALERRLLENRLREIITQDARDAAANSDQARLLRERAVDVFSVAEGSLSRCIAFTYGYGSVGLLQALDGIFQSFIDMWTADVSMVSSSSTRQEILSGEDLSDLDYTAQDWSEFQQSLHLLASARSVNERLSAFEAKLRANLGQVAAKFRLARNDPANFPITACRGEGNLLEQSTLNSAELHALLDRVDSSDPSHSRDGFQTSATAGLRHQHPHVTPGSTDDLLIDAHAAVFSFARACQASLQGTILSPLRKHLSSYHTLSHWTNSNDPTFRRTVTANDLQVPTFSLSPSDTVQRVAEGLLNLPRLFEVYEDDDALSFSLRTLPHVDGELLKSSSDGVSTTESGSTATHMRRQSLTSPPMPPKTSSVDPAIVSSAWLASLGMTLLSHLTTSVLPKISTLTAAGAAQLSSDLGYLSNIVSALNVEFEDLERWKEYVDMDDQAGGQKLKESDSQNDSVLQNVARMRGWR